MPTDAKMYQPSVPDNVHIDLTSSACDKYLWCPQMYYWRYVRGWSSPERSLPLEVGILFHRGLEVMRSVGAGHKHLKRYVDTVVHKAERGVKPDKTNSGIASFLIQVYALRYLNDNLRPVYVEPTFTMKVHGRIPIAIDSSDQIVYEEHSCIVGGRMDSLSEDENGDLWLVESKTTYTIDELYLARLPMDRQLHTYGAAALALDLKIKGAIYDVVCRPRQYKKKTETWEQYFARAAIDFIQSPQSYFARQKCLLDPRLLDTIGQQYVEIHYAILRSLKFHSWMRNTAACFIRNRECPYSPLCIHGETPSICAYYKPRVPFEELRPEAELPSTVNTDGVTTSRMPS